MANVDKFKSPFDKVTQTQVDTDGLTEYVSEIWREVSTYPKTWVKEPRPRDPIHTCEICGVIDIVTGLEAVDREWIMKITRWEGWGGIACFRGSDEAGKMGVKTLPQSLLDAAVAARSGCVFFERILTAWMEPRDFSKQEPDNQLVLLAEKSIKLTVNWGDTQMDVVNAWISIHGRGEPVPEHVEQFTICSSSGVS